ncbi:hypothetical protein [Arthrobacter sp. NicSoilC5]|uniref:hypothetical protein n=1 Tax=Arthrobacter sp. NicSoilC5 TaxID=2831000 RepID=UPI001CC6C9A5|nr:hypothetical protein [Arthrobacter sp. NicSoilC5]
MNPEEEPETGDEVELISDGENLLVVGDKQHAVESFLRTKGLLERAREISLQELGPALRSSAGLLQTVSEAVTNSGLWVKITPESADAIKEFGLTDSGVPGVAYAMAGTRGSIKEWLRIDTTAGARAANPAVLSGIAGALSQAARQQEVAQLRQFLGKLDQKLDYVLRGQRDDILGDLAGIEGEIRAALRTAKLEGQLDSLTWSKLSGASLEIRQVQSKAILKLAGIADDFDLHKRIGDLNQHLPHAKSGVQLWLATIARCTAALDELAILEIDHYATIAPGQVNARRMSLEASRRDDQAELHEGISVLLRRMDSAADLANQNKIFHVKAVPAVIGSIEQTRGLIKRFYVALNIEVDWDSLDPIEWSAAIREWRQWRNGLVEGGSLAWEKGKPVLGTIALTVLTAAVKDKIKLPGKPWN